MKKYLSFGGGVNSVAMYLLLMDQGVEFDALFVNHFTDYPETYEYLRMFNRYIKTKEHLYIRQLIPKEGNLYDYCYEKSMVPAIYPRWCTRQFKIKPLADWYKIMGNGIQFIGIDIGETHRIRESGIEGIENKYPLIEAGMNREDCKKYIKSHGLPVPKRSGCYICPFQGIGQWQALRMNHPDLFQRAVKLEQRNIEYRKSKGKEPMYLSPRKASLLSIVEENQLKLFKRDEYPELNQRKVGDARNKI